MPIIGAYAKLAEILARAERGERFTVTKNGRPVAEIGPVRVQGDEAARAAAERILARLDALL